MHISELAAKQKRILDWKEFLAITQVHPKLKEKITSTLAVLSKILTDCWTAGAVTDQHQARILDLERELEMLNEDVRLTAAQTLSREVEK